MELKLKISEIPDISLLSLGSEIFFLPKLKTLRRRRVSAGGVVETTLRSDLRDGQGGRGVLMDKIRIPLRSASVRTPHLFHQGIPKVLVNPRSKGITSD
jgi:hypothetical protein